MPMLYCFEYFGFVIYFEIRKCDAPSYFFFLKIALAILGLLWFHMNNFRIIFFYFCEKFHWDFDRDYIESIDHFE